MEPPSLSKEYHRVKNHLFFAGFLLNLTVLFFFLKSGFSVRLRELSCGVSSHFFLLNAVYVTILGLGMYLVSFPLSFFEGFLWEHKFELSNQKFLDWFRDNLKEAVLSLVILIVAVEAVYIFLRKFPATWWIAASLFWLFLTLFLAKLTPNVIIPLFYKYSPLKDAALRNSLLDLFKKTGIKIRDVYLINFSQKTKKANAFICGLGGNRRVVLSDTLIEKFSVPEIETIVAHEIAHYKNHDTLRLSFFHSFITVIGFFLIHKVLYSISGWFGLERVDDIASLPLIILCLSLFGFVTMPVVNGYSRHVETQADRFCLNLTGRPLDFIAVMKKLGEINLAEFFPSMFNEILFYDHPPIGKRIQLAEDFKKP